MEQLTCEQCGAEWARERVRGRKPKLCAGCRAPSTPRRKQPRPTLECVGCGDTFRPRPDSKGYCTRDCAYKHIDQWKHVQPKQPKPPKQRPAKRATCAGCDVEFRPKHFGQMYCTPECREESVRARARAKYYKRKARAGVVTRPYAQRKQDGRMSSGECAHCGDPFRRVGPARRCTLKCTEDAARQRREKRIRGAYIESVSLAYIIKRDGGRCQICGRKVDATKVVPHPRAPTRDHIIPLNKNGTHERKNVQLACFECNCAKGDGSAGGQLLLVG